MKKINLCTLQIPLKTKPTLEKQHKPKVEKCKD